MRQLILVRHAKSSWDNPDLDDFDRPLNKRGKRDAPFMAKLLAEKTGKPDLIISSPALRTKLTALEIAQKTGYDEGKIIWNEKFYMASSSKLLDEISSVDHNVNSLLIVGHNPGLTDLHNFLCKYEIDNIPTCGIVCLRTNKDWGKINSKDFQLEFFEYPKRYFK